MILAHTRRTGEEHVCDGAFRNEFQKRESMAARSRPGSKQARVLAMLGREEGVTIADNARPIGGSTRSEASLLG